MKPFPGLSVFYFQLIKRVKRTDKLGHNGKPFIDVRASRHFACVVCGECKGC
jgi:hypothetical protein